MKAFDVIEQIYSRLLASQVMPSVHSISLEQTEEALGVGGVGELPSAKEIAAALAHVHHKHEPPG